MLKKNSILLIFLTALFVYSTLTFLQAKYNFYIMCGGYLLFFAIASLQRIIIRIDKHLLIIFVIAACSSVLFVFNNNTAYITTYLSSILYLFFWYEAYAIVTEEVEIYSIAKFCRFNMAILIISIVATLRVLSLYPLAARAMYGYADNITDKTHLFNMGCAGYGFIYAMVIVLYSTCSAIKNKCTKYFFRIPILICISLLIVLLVVKSEFTFALLIAAFIIVLTIKKSGLKYKDVIIGILLLLLVLLLFKDQILRILDDYASISGNVILHQKIYSIRVALSSSDISKLSRFEKYIESIQLFFSSPLFGTGHSGQHSQILDSLAYNGIFGLAYITFFGEIIGRIKRRIGKYGNEYEILNWILAFVGLYTDYAMISITVFFAPLVLHLINTEDNNKIGLLR